MLQPSASQDKVNICTAMSIISVYILLEALLHREPVTALPVFSNAYVAYRAEQTLAQTRQVSERGCTSVH